MRNLLLCWIPSLWIACSPDEGPRAPVATGLLDILPQQVVVVGPSTAETLCAMGLADSVVAVSDWCRAAALQDRPRIGGIADPSLERVLAAQPDLVLCQGDIPALEALCRQQQIPLRAFHTDTWQDWENEVFTLGQLFGVPKIAQNLVEQAQHELAAVQARRPPGEPPSVLLVVARRPEEASGCIVAGGPSFLSFLVESAGGRNLFSDSQRPYFDLIEEELLKTPPDVILEFAIPNNPDPLSLWRQGWRHLSAVENGRVHAIAEDFVVQPGPRMAKAARLIQKRLFDPLAEKVTE